MRNLRLALILSLLLCLPLPLYAADHAARVTDISDRAYEPAVIELLDNAKKSIVISMYIIEAEGNTPVRLLVKDLEEALDRGVSVDIYLNTRFKAGHPLDIEKEEVVKILRKKGARIFAVTPSRRMHDKLIIVDSHYVVIGSANWSVSSLKNNYEAVALVDSPEFANDMLLRLRQHTLQGDEPEKAEKARKERRDVILKEDSVVTLSCALLNNLRLFPRMVSQRAVRAMDAYLLLKAYAVEQGEDEYFISLEQLAVDLGMPAKWSVTAQRRQVIKVLASLKNRYKLIDVTFKHGKDAWIRLKDLSGDTFELEGKFLNPEYLSKLSQPAKFALLLKAMLEEEGTPVTSFTMEDLSKRFHLDTETLRKGLREISKVI
ncbi:MAG: hypothetical protein JW976_13815 [Syntrophaceae bacterium]|nr:hypothetical protein [Syntrophaceae bacterium]